MPQEENSLYTFDAVEDSVESAFALHFRVRAWTYWVFVFLIVSALVALPLVKVDVSIGVPGLVRASSDRVSIQVPADGYIQSISVADNKTVKEGDVLLILQSQVIEERQIYNQEQMADVNGRLTDLATIIKVVDDSGWSDGNTDDWLVVLKSTPATFQTQAYAKQFDMFLAQITPASIRLLESTEELERLEQLYKKGLITRQSLDQARFAQRRSAADRSQIIEQNLNRWHLERRENEQTRVRLAAEQRQLDEERKRRTIRAPIAGTALGFLGRTPGAYVASGELLGDISPNDQLQFEARIEPKDIGFVSRGQSAKLQVDAFHYSQWGMLDAVVKDISNDIVVDGQRPAFKVLMTIPRPELMSPRGMPVRVTKGMTAHARLLVTERTLLELLYQNLSQWIDPTAPTRL